MTFQTGQTKWDGGSIYIYFGIELVQVKLDELVKDVMNLDIKKESMDDNHGHSHD